MVQKPDYITQAGEDGSFVLSGLAPSDYRLIAARDEFGDLLYSIGQDYFGVPQFPVTLNEADTLFAGIKFKLALEDTIPPAVSELTMINSHSLVVKFSELIKLESLTAQNFSIIDSSLGTEITDFLLQKVGTKEKEIVLSFSDSLATESDVSLITHNLTDIYGNTSIRAADGFTVSDRADTTAPVVKQIETKTKSKTIAFKNPQFIIRLSKSIYMKSFQKSVSFFDKNLNKLSIETELLDDANLVIEVHGKLKPKSKYTLSYNLAEAVDVSGNKGDSVRTRNFTTFGKLDFSGVFGKVEGDLSAENILNLYSVDGKKREYLSTAAKDGSYEFESVLPGKYMLWCFEDADSNSEYSYGKVQPFSFSERFAYYPDTLNLRARWPLVDVFLKY